MPQTMTFSGRFQWWSYTVSHGQLLLRRTKETTHPTRVDVLFKDVAAVSLPTTFFDLSVCEESAEVHGEIQGAWALDGRKLFRVRGRNYCGYVVAGAVVLPRGHEGALGAQRVLGFVVPAHGTQRLSKTNAGRPA